MHSSRWARVDAYFDRVSDGGIAWKSSRDHRSLVFTRHELPLSQRDRPVQFVDLDPLDLLIT